MSDKITWADILSDFKKKHPKLSRRTVDYHPYGYMKIIVLLTEGEKLIYDFFDKKVCFVKT